MEIKEKFIDLTYHQVKAKSLSELKETIPLNFLWMQQCSKNYDWVSYKCALFTEELEEHDYRLKIQNEKYNKLSIPGDLHRKIKQENPNVVLVHGLNNYLQVVHLRWVLGRRVKLMVQHHGERPSGFLKMTLLRLSALFVDAFLFTSQETARQLRLPQKKPFLLMEGSSDFQVVPQPEARNKLKLPEKEIIYLWVGRLIPVKNPLFFLEEFVLFLKQQPSARLYVIYHEETLLEECLNLTRGQNTIHVLGRLPHEELRDWYSAADYFVSASLHEGSGYALCEAMACGCIPLVPSIGAFQFMTANGACALMYESGSRKSLQEVLAKSLVLDKTQARKKVLKQFNEQLSFEAIAKSLFRITGALHKSNK